MLKTRLYFFVTHGINTTSNELNNYLTKINSRAYQWKMSFSADPSKQAQEVAFSRWSKKIIHPPLFFSNIQVSQSSSQKHLVVILGEQLTFCEHLKMVASKISKTIGPLRKLQNLLPSLSLLTMYKAFVRPHLDYGDIICDEAFNASFH